jgi:subtilisin inhibitor-like
MRFRHLGLVPLVLVAAGCFGGSSSSSVGQTRLTVVVHGKNGTTPWHTTWTLRCSPAGGTHPKPRASCAALADLLARHAVPPRHCATEIGGPWTTVKGVYAGKAISLAYAEACAADRRTSLNAQALGAYFAHG